MASLSREDLIKALPAARRYARALSGSRAAGDALVAASLTALLDGPSDLADARLALYRAVSTRFTPSGSGNPALSLRQRQLLLLTALEDLPLPEAARVLGDDDAKAHAVLDDARTRLRDAATADVLIIEDEPIIALDIEELVAGCGHRVVGVAGSEAEAVALAERTRPGLILADINLGTGGDGSHAVARIQQQLDVPVIFVTAYPERLLTGAASEPAFVITKPFEPLSLAIATYQAVTGGVQAMAGFA